MKKTKVRYFIEDRHLYKAYNDEEAYEAVVSLELFLAVLESEEKFGWLE